MLITPGYLPDKSKIENALTRYLGTIDTVDVPEDGEQRAAWLLGSLARRHVGSYYKRKQQRQELVLDTWVIQQGQTEKSGLEDWFTLTAAGNKDFRLYLHAYPRDQVNCTLATNVFAYPHKLLGTRRGRNAGEAAICASSQGYLQRLAECYVSSGTEATTSMLRDTHDAGFSSGMPAR